MIRATVGRFRARRFVHCLSGGRRRQSAGRGAVIWERRMSRTLWSKAAVQALLTELAAGEITRFPQPEKIEGLTDSDYIPEPPVIRTCTVSSPAAA